jgi:hypothetical protein
MRQGNIEKNESRSRNARYDFEGVESKGRAGRLFNQVTENLPDMEDTLRYFGSNWKTIAQAFTVLGLLGAASTIARKNGFSVGSLGRSSIKGGKSSSRSGSKARH